MSGADTYCLESGRYAGTDCGNRWGVLRRRTPCMQADETTRVTSGARAGRVVVIALFAVLLAVGIALFVGGLAAAGAAS